MLIRLLPKTHVKTCFLVGKDGSLFFLTLVPAYASVRVQTKGGRAYPKGDRGAVCAHAWITAELKEA